MKEGTIEFPIDKVVKALEELYAADGIILKINYRKKTEEELKEQKA